MGDEACTVEEVQREESYKQVYTYDHRGGVGKGIGVTVDGVNWIHLIVGRTSSLMFVVSSKKRLRVLS